MKEAPSENNLDKDVEDFEKWKKEYEENEKRELKEDLEKFDNRPKPAYYPENVKNSMRGDSPEYSFFEMEPETRYELRIKEEAGFNSLQFREWVNTELSSEEKKKVNLNSIVGGKGVTVRDIVGDRDFFYPHASQN